MDRTEPLRVGSPLTVLLFAPAMASAQTAPDSVDVVPSGTEYRLGGAAYAETIESPVASESPLHELAQFGLSIRPVSPATPGETRPTDIGDISIFGREMMSSDFEGEVLVLGTALTRNRFTTGARMMFAEQSGSSQSEVFLGYSVSKNLSVGVSGILADQRGADRETAAMLGLSAAYTLEGGTYLQGGFAGAPETVPVYGLSLGFRF